MRLWKIPWPWDYHGMGCLVVMAESREAAVSAGQTWFTTTQGTNNRGTPLKWDEVEELTDQVYEDKGCDC